MEDLVLGFQSVVWDGTKSQYVLQISLGLAAHLHRWLEQTDGRVSIYSNQVKQYRQIAVSINGGQWQNETANL